MKKKKKLFSVSSLLMASLLYGFFPILTRVVGFKLPIFFQNWTRSLLEFILIIPLISMKRWVKIIPKDYGWLIGRTLGGAVGFLGGFYAFNYLQIGTTYFIFYAGTLIGGFFLGKLFFNEKISKLKLIVLFIGMIGLYLVYPFDLKSKHFIYILLALASGLGTAFWNISSKKISIRYSALQLNFIDIVLYGMLMFIISIFLKETWTFPVWTTVWLANCLFGIVMLLTGQLIVYGFKNVEGQIGSLLLMMEVVFGIIFGLIFYQEAIPIKTLLGGFFILFALIASQLKIKNKLLN